MSTGLAIAAGVGVLALALAIVWVTYTALRTPPRPIAHIDSDHKLRRKS